MGFCEWSLWEKKEKFILIYLINCVDRIKERWVEKDH